MLDLMYDGDIEAYEITGYNPELEILNLLLLLCKGFPFLCPSILQTSLSISQTSSIGPSP